MKISGGLEEDGVVIGNTYDKYSSSNPLVRRIMRGFECSLSDLVAKSDPSSIHEIGCGEGYWTLRWAKQGLEVRGSDFSDDVLKIARLNAEQQGISKELFTRKSIYDLSAEVDSADLVVCCEVLEHLEEPVDAMRALKRVARKNLILSVPREPIWSLMNIARGKYWGDLGNTPGHIQRWSQRSFIALVSEFFQINTIKAPIPWTMLLCKV
jgi:2-polyprenyl-3-methyl-5-hydroxy-6-metoxy-1,4-benzoquinol methylase